MKAPKRIAAVTAVFTILTAAGLYMSFTSSPKENQHMAQNQLKYPQYIPDSSKSALFNKAQALVFKGHYLAKHLGAVEETQAEVNFGKFVESVIAENEKIDYTAYPNDYKLSEMTLAFFLKYKMS